MICPKCKHKFSNKVSLNVKKKAFKMFKKGFCVTDIVKNLNGKISRHSVHKIIQDYNTLTSLGMLANEKE